MRRLSKVLLYSDLPTLNITERESIPEWLIASIWFISRNVHLLLAAGVLSLTSFYFWNGGAVCLSGGGAQAVGETGCGGVLVPATAARAGIAEASISARGSTVLDWNSSLFMVMVGRLVDVQCVLGPIWNWIIIWHIFDHGRRPTDSDLLHFSISVFLGALQLWTCSLTFSSCAAFDDFIFVLLRFTLIYHFFVKCFPTCNSFESARFIGIKVGPIGEYVIQSSMFFKSHVVL